MCTRLFEVQEFFVRIITMKHYFYEQDMMLISIFHRMSYDGSISELKGEISATYICDYLFVGWRIINCIRSNCIVLCSILHDNHIRFIAQLGEHLLSNRRSVVRVHLSLIHYNRKYERRIL